MASIAKDDQDVQQKLELAITVLLSQLQQRPISKNELFATIQTQFQQQINNRNGRNTNNDDNKNNNPRRWIHGCVLNGKTNYSYKLSITINNNNDDDDNNNNNNNNSIYHVFAKVCFPYALWNPDPTAVYDLERVENEFTIMQYAQSIYNDNTHNPPNANTNLQDASPVATPYCCVDVINDDDSTTTTPLLKVLFCQWSECHTVEWAQEFVQGRVNLQIVKGVAQALARLNSSTSTIVVTENDNDNDNSSSSRSSSTTALSSIYFNDGVRPCMKAMIEHCRQVVMNKVGNNNNNNDNNNNNNDNDIDNDKTIKYCQTVLGQERMIQLIDELEVSYNRRDVLLHSDAHPFNILVSSASSKSLSNYHSSSFVLCDWEMSFYGPKGRDVGMWQGWPIVCALCHAANHQKETAFHLIDCIDQFWNAYYDEIMKTTTTKTTTTTTTPNHNKNDNNNETPSNNDNANHDMEHYACQVFRDAMGWTSSFTFYGCYLFDLHMEHISFLSENNNKKQRAKASIGYTGIQLAEYGFGNKEPNLTLHELRQRFRSILETDINELLDINTYG